MLSFISDSVDATVHAGFGEESCDAAVVAEHEADAANPWIGPPDPIDGCFSRLSDLGVQFSVAHLPVHRARGGDFECGAPQAVRYRRGPLAIGLRGAPVLSCPMALAWTQAEIIIQRIAKEELGRTVAYVQHAGTYNCREMAAYPGWVSEHSYANALDIKSFVLEGGRVVSVGKSYQEQNGVGRFLRRLTRELYDREIFSVVLTPNFDGLHRRHLHLDMARYRVDGT